VLLTNYDAPRSKILTNDYLLRSCST